MTCPRAFAATKYVSINSTNPVAPYNDWSTAATNIQDAIDAAVASDLVLVADGIYETGGKVVHGNLGNLTNRVAIDKAVKVQSLNGPEVTVIRGEGPLGPKAVRCVYLATSAQLAGFTLTNGATFTPGRASVGWPELFSGGGAWCQDTSAVISNCVITGNSADYDKWGLGGGVYQGTVHNSLIAENRGIWGGGAYGAVLLECTLRLNSAAYDPAIAGNFADTFGGGAYQCALTNCTIANNSAGSGGGGTALCTLSNCTVIQNSAYGRGGGTYYGTATGSRIFANFGTSGGGCYSGTMDHCIIATNSGYAGAGVYFSDLDRCQVFDNTALVTGGGANQATLRNSAIFRNAAWTNGGGAFGGVLVNCTITGNFSAKGGGTDSAVLTNSIIYHNQAASGSNHTGGSLEYCCTSPLPGSGAGNLASDPLLSSLFHISQNSACRAAGLAAVVSGTDLDGQPWSAMPSIGCDEVSNGSSTGALNVAIKADHLNALPGFPLKFTARIDGIPTESSWDFGSGAMLTNQPQASHSWGSPGVYTVTLTAFNDDFPAGVSGSVSVRIMDSPIQYVSQASTTPVAPFLSWATAATNIQDAVDAAFVGGSTILVSNGVYRTGGGGVPGFLTNRVNVTTPMTIRSVNGPQVTVIEGFRQKITFYEQGIRCVQLCDGAQLTGFTITNGATLGRGSLGSSAEASGGGIFCQSAKAFISDCLIVSNSCIEWGAGVYSGTLSNCFIGMNQDWVTGSESSGAAAFSSLVDCTIAGNFTAQGGVMNCQLNNCLLSTNTGIGAINSFLTNCVISGHTNYGYGGGTLSSVLQSCTLMRNSALWGGGAYNCSLISCSIISNSATSSGGGAAWSTQQPTFTGAHGYGNLLIGNVAAVDGGGVYNILNGPFALTNWTFERNSAGRDGGGLFSQSFSGQLKGCSFIGNSAGASGGGALATSLVPLSCFSCFFSDNSAGADGGAIQNATLIGCSLFGNRARSGGGLANGRLSDCIVSNNTASVDGGGAHMASATNTSFLRNRAGNGGGLHNLTFGMISNCSFVANSALTNGGGILGPTGMMVKRSTIISNEAGFGGGGFYGTYADCVIMGNTAVNGGGVYNVGSTSSSNNFLAYNSATLNGGGVFAGFWSNCVFQSNSAGGNGGGACNADLTSCIVTQNRAGTNGGGVSGSTTGSLIVSNEANFGGGFYGGNLTGSTVVGNVARNAGGGAYLSTGGTLRNNILFYNSSVSGSNYVGGIHSFSCAAPLPTGTSNISSAPLFADLNSGNLRLAPNSPCINAGAGTSGTKDLDGRPRIVGGRIDIGAYEFQGLESSDFIAWLGAAGLPTDGSADFADADNDGMNNWKEWRSRTDPQDAASLLRLVAPFVTNNGSGLAITWQSVPDVTYFLERSSELNGESGFLTVESDIQGQPGTTTYLDTSAGDGPFFYRIGVQD